MHPTLSAFATTARDLVSALKLEMNSVRTNRPSASLVEDIKVDYFGQFLPIKQLGSIGVNPPREVVVTAWDKNAAGAIAKAIENSSLGVMPAMDGSTIRFQLPALSEERRDEVVKLAKAVAEKVRIKLRTARDEANKQIGSSLDAKTITEDDRFTLKKRVQEAVDKANEAIDEIVSRKVTEINE